MLCEGACTAGSTATEADTAPLVVIRPEWSAVSGATSPEPSGKAPGLEVKVTPHVLYAPPGAASLHSALRGLGGQHDDACGC